MRKLAFEHAGNGAFEMPKFRMVQLEKENNNVVFAKPKTVYKGSKFSYSRSAALKAALAAEEVDGGSTSFAFGVTEEV